MSSHHTIEVDGDLVGILTPDHERRAFRFHSGISPFDLLNGSRFFQVNEAIKAAKRIKLAAETARAPLPSALDTAL